MTDRTPEERIRHRGEDEPEVEGHRLRHGPEEPSEEGRMARLDEDAGEEGPDVEGHRMRH